SFSTCNSYRPTGNRVNRNTPLVSEDVVCVKPVSTFLTFTRASGTSAPLWSDILPPKLAVVYWARSETLKQRMQANTTGDLLGIMRILPWRGQSPGRILRWRWAGVNGIWLVGFGLWIWFVSRQIEP